MLHHLRVMTGAILLYDHVSRDGAFCSKSDIKVRHEMASVDLLLATLD